MQKLAFNGVHEIQGFRHLFQPTCPDGFNYVGLKGEIGVSTRGLRNCPHAIPPTLGLRPAPRNAWEMFKELALDPLVNAMLPIPKDAKKGTGVYVVENRPDLMSYLACLERMSSPMHRGVRSLWTARPTLLAKELTYTNVQPLVLHNVEANDTAMVRKLITMAHETPRTLIIVKEPSQDLLLGRGVTEIETRITEWDLDKLITLPFEQLGANVMVNYCRYRGLFDDLGS